jgi:hypothetical protein
VKIDESVRQIAQNSQFYNTKFRSQHSDDKQKNQKFAKILKNVWPMREIN